MADIDLISCCLLLLTLVLAIAVFQLQKGNSNDIFYFCTAASLFHHHFIPFRSIARTQINVHASKQSYLFMLKAKGYTHTHAYILEANYWSSQHKIFLNINTKRTLFKGYILSSICLAIQIHEHTDALELTIRTHPWQI